MYHSTLKPKKLGYLSYNLANVSEDQRNKLKVRRYWLHDCLKLQNWNFISHIKTNTVKPPMPG